MNVPILGNTSAVPDQTRLNVLSMVDETIASARKLGLSVGRLKLTMPLESNDVVYPLALEGFEQRGCRLIAVNEMAVPLPQGATLLVSIVFRLPLD